MNTARLRLLVLAGACLLGSCGGRPSYWNDPVNTSSATFGLARGVAVIDDADHRALLLTGAADQELKTQSVPIGHNFASAVTSVDGSTLFVLSSGDQPIQKPSDQPPSLTVIQLDTSFQVTSTFYTMTEPLSNLAIDPIGTTDAPGSPSYAVAYSGTAKSFAQNQNEIVIFDLKRGFVPEPGSAAQPPNPVSRSIRSYGGTPQQLTFSPSMMLPANISATDAMAGVKASARRLLLIETNIDVSIVDLTHAFDPPASPSAPFGRAEITVRLTSGTAAASLTPTGLVVDPIASDGRIAFFTTGDQNVYSLQLIPSPPGSTNPNDFNPQINLTPVAATPSDIQFVTTNDGLRIAALLPTMSSAVLIEPVMSVTTQVALASPYSSMSLVTSVVSGAAPTAPSGTPPTDVALLWGSANGAASGVALWTLGTAVGQAYRSIEVLQIGASIQSVLDVPAPNDHLKVLATQANAGGDFYVLDLIQRTANPILTTTSAQLAIAPDGLRMWAYDQGTDLAEIDFTTLNPVPLITTAPISVVYDVANPGGGRSLVAINAEGTLGATVFNALMPEATTGGTTSRRDVALLLPEGP
jgi:hypothetical protein